MSTSMSLVRVSKERSEADHLKHKTARPDSNDEVTFLGSY